MTTSSLKVIFTFAFALSFLSFAIAQNIIFVSPQGDGNGNQWSTTTNLHSAIAKAKPNTQLWLAAGTYLPTSVGDRTASFHINKDIKIYGGFVGTEQDLSERNPLKNETILSGEIGTEDFKDNSYSVVTLKNVTSQMILDGLTITNGCANGDTEQFSPLRNGGAVFNHSTGIYASSPTVNNCIFKNNTAREGGAWFNHSAGKNCGAKFSFCKFVSNNADLDGGAVYTNPLIGKSKLYFSQCIFEDNMASYGAGIYSNANAGQNLVILETCQFNNNMAYMWGAAVYGNEKLNFSIAISDCIFLENYPTNINKEITVGQVDTSEFRASK